MSALRSGAVLAAAAMTCVGSSVAVSATIVDAPLFTLQAVRYTLAALLLALLGRATGTAAAAPARAGVGVALRGGADGPGAVQRRRWSAVSRTPSRRSSGWRWPRSRWSSRSVGRWPPGAGPRPRWCVGAGVVTAGAALVSGGGRTDLAGLGWAAVVLAGEVAFTLLAVPVLRRLGPWAVRCTRCGWPRWCWRCSAVVVDGAGRRAHVGRAATSSPPHTWPSSSPRWRSCSGTARWPGIGADRAGLFTGVVPVTAAVGGVLLGAPGPGIPWCGRAWRWSRSGWASACPRESAPLPPRVGPFAAASRPLSRR